MREYDGGEEGDGALEGAKVEGEEHNEWKGSRMGADIPSSGP